MRLRTPTPRTGRPRPQRWAALVAPGAALIAAVVVRVIDPPLIQELRWRVFDRYQQLAPRAVTPLPVRVVDIDDETLRRVGQWPWPRTRVAALIEALARQGAGPIALDLIFAEPDRTSPEAVINLWPDEPSFAPLRDAAKTLPDHDALLAQSIAKASVVTGFALTDHGQPGSRAPAVKAGFAVAGVDPKPFVAMLPGCVINLPALEQAAAGNGHVSLLMEPDGLTRRVPLLLEHAGQLYPSLAAEAIRVAQGVSTYVVKTAQASGERVAGARTGLVSLKIGARTVPTDAGGQLWLYATPRVPARTVPAWQVLDGSAPREAIEGSIVFVGSSATGLKDIRATSLDPATPGVEVHAQLAEQILAQQFLRRPDWADGAELVYLLALGIVLIVLLPRAGAVACALLGTAAIAAAIGGSWWAFRRAHWLLDPVMPSLAMLGIYLVASFVNFRSTETQRRRVREAFGRYLSPLLVERLAQHPDQLRLGGESRVMTVLFADIRGFTAIAEQLDAQALTRFLNDFFTPMTAVILEHQGTIDKYIGDCIMAFWNAPIDDPGHARHACEAALAMRNRLEAWNHQRHAQGAGAAPVRLGIGLNTGACCVGNLGSEQRFDYSILGDAVNLAARIEELTKTYGVDILAGESTAAGAADFAWLELDALRVRGKQEPVRVFVLVGDASLVASPEFRAVRAAHERLIAACRAGSLTDARVLCDQCVALAPPAWGLAPLYEALRARLHGGANPAAPAASSTTSLPPAR